MLHYCSHDNTEADAACFVSGCKGKDEANNPIIQHATCIIIIGLRGTFIILWTESNFMSQFPRIHYKSLLALTNDPKSP